MKKYSTILAIIFGAAVITIGIVGFNKLKWFSRTMSEPDSDASVLTGLDGVFVGIHLHFEANYTNEDAVAYKGEIERQLRDKGIRVFSADELSRRYYSTKPVAHLSAFIRVAHAGEGNEGSASESHLVYTTSVEVLEEARLIRSPNHVHQVRTWNCVNHGLMPSDTTCKDLCETAQDCIDSFVEEFVQANGADVAASG